MPESLTRSPNKEHRILNAEDMTEKILSSIFFIQRSLFEIHKGLYIPILRPSQKSNFTQRTCLTGRQATTTHNYHNHHNHYNLSLSAQRCQGPLHKSNAARTAFSTHNDHMIQTRHALSQHTTFPLQRVWPWILRNQKTFKPVLFNGLVCPYSQVIFG